MTVDKLRIAPKRIRQPQVLCDYHEFDGTIETCEVISSFYITFDDDFTVHGWINTTKPGVILSKDSMYGTTMNGSKVFAINGHEGDVTLDFWTPGLYRGKSHIADGIWHHVAYQFQRVPPEVRLYVDGKEESDNRMKILIIPEPDLDSHVLKVGYSNSLELDPFEGIIENLKYEPTCLGGEQIAHLFRKGRSYTHVQSYLRLSEWEIFPKRKKLELTMVQSTIKVRIGGILEISMKEKAALRQTISELCGNISSSRIVIVDTERVQSTIKVRIGIQCSTNIDQAHYLTELGEIERLVHQGLKDVDHFTERFMINCSRFDAFMGHSFMILPTEPLKRSKHWVNPFPEDFLVDVYCWSSLQEQRFNELDQAGNRVAEGFARILGLERNHIDIQTRHVGYNYERERDFLSSVHHCRLRFHTKTDAQHVHNFLSDEVTLKDLSIAMDAKIDACSSRIFASGKGGGLRSACTLPGYSGVILISKNGNVYGWTPESNLDLYSELQPNFSLPPNVEKMCANLEIHHTNAVCYVECSKIVFSFHPDKLRIYSAFWDGTQFDLKLRQVIDYSEIKDMPEEFMDAARDHDENTLRYVHSGKKAKRERGNFHVDAVVAVGHSVLVFVGTMWIVLDWEDCDLEPLNELNIRPNTIEPKLIVMLSVVKGPQYIKEETLWSTLPTHWKAEGFDTATALSPPSMFGDVEMLQGVYQMQEHEKTAEIDTKKRVNLEDSFTLSAWVYLKHLGDCVIVGEKPPGTLVQYCRSLSIVDNNLVFDYRGVEMCTAEFEFEYKRWYHTAVTFAKSTHECTLFIDGDEVARKKFYNIKAVKRPIETQRWVMRVGMNLHGRVGNVAYFNNVVTPEYFIKEHPERGLGILSQVLTSCSIRPGVVHARGPRNASSVRKQTIYSVRTQGRKKEQFTRSELYPIPRLFLFKNSEFVQYDLHTQRIVSNPTFFESADLPQELMPWDEFNEEKALCFGAIVTGELTQPLRYAFESSVAEYFDIPVCDVCLSQDSLQTRGRYAARELAELFNLDETESHNMYIRRTFDNSAEIQEKFKDHPLMLTVCNKKFVQKQLKYIHEDEIRVESMFCRKTWGAIRAPRRGAWNSNSRGHRPTHFHVRPAIQSKCPRRIPNRARKALLSLQRRFFNWRNVSNPFQKRRLPRHPNPCKMSRKSTHTHP